MSNASIAAARPQPESDDLYLAMLEAAQEGIWRVDSDLVTRYVNPFMAALMGRERDRMVGLPAIDCVAPGRRGDVQRRYASRREGRAERYETELLRGDGTPLWVRISSTPVYNGHGEFVGAFAIVSDISSERAAETRSRLLTEELCRVERRFQLVARASHDVLWEHDLVNRSTWYSDSLEALFGHASDSIRGSADWLKLIHPDDRRTVLASIRQALAERRELMAESYRFRRADGSWAHVFDRAFIEYRDGEPSRIVGSMMDVTERVEALQTLERREREYQTLLESVPDVIARFDRDLRQVYANPAADRLFDLLRRSKNGLRPSEMGLPPKDAAVWEGALREVFATGEERRVVFSGPGADGHRWFQARIVPESSADGTIETVLEIIRDVTDIKRAEEELRQKSSDLAERVKESRCLYSVSDILNRWTDEPVGDVLRRVLGSLPGGWRHSDIARARLTLDGASYATPGFRPTPWSMVAKIGSNGSTRGMVEVVYLEPPAGEDEDDPFLPQEHDLLRAVAQRIDETIKRRTAEMGLSRSEAYFRSLIENAHDVISILSADGTIRYESPAIERLLGSRQGDHVGLNGFDRVHPEDRERLARTMERGIAGGVARIIAQYRMIRKDGTICHVESTAVNLLEDPVVAGIVVATRDLTERRELEGQLHQAQKMEAVGRLAGGVAHDFNNALTVIQGHGELLRSATDEDSPLHESAREIQEAAERATRLTRQLLAFSKREMVEPQRVDVNSVVADMRKMLVRLIGEDVHLVTGTEPDLPAILSDPGQIEQVLMNLVVNARDAVTTGGTIAVRTRRGACPEGIGVTGDHANGCIVIEVEDDGIGMPEETAARVFEPFFTTKTEGTGLGLSIVYGIVEQSRGRVEVESRVGGGTTFRIHLPAVSAESEPKNEATPPLDPAGPLRGRVLLVEDDEAVRDLSHRILERTGLEVIASACPSAAIEEFEKGVEFDLLLTDVVMPEMSGQDLADRLRLAHPDLVVLFMSGYAQDERVLETVERDPRSHFLPKPFTPANLVRAVAGVLAG